MTLSLAEAYKKTFLQTDIYLTKETTFRLACSVTTVIMNEVDCGFKLTNSVMHTTKSIIKHKIFKRKTIYSNIAVNNSGD